jgi:hypothetical protein
MIEYPASYSIHFKNAMSYKSIACKFIRTVRNNAGNKAGVNIETS